MNEKSILEQALLQVQTLEEAVKQNAKGILSSTMKKELNELLKEAKKEEKEEEVPEEEEEGVTHEEEETVTQEEEDDEVEEEEEEETNDDQEMDDESSDEDAEFSDEDEESDSEEDEYSADDQELPDTSDSDSMDSQDSMDSSDSMDTSDDDVYDMTNSSDDEVLRVFKALKPEDGVVVKKDGNHLDIDMGDDEFLIKLDEEVEDEFSEDNMSLDNYEESEEGFNDEFHENLGDDYNEESDPELRAALDDITGDLNKYGDESSDVEEETIYEIELDEEDDDIEPKADTTEAARTKSNPHGNKAGLNRSGLPSKKKYKAGSGSINEEYKKLKRQNNEYRKALVLFKDKLNEVAVFNANLAYATRLFTEHATTKKEKLNILKRFDSVSTMNESKNLYKTIKTELEIKKPISESVVEKISNSPTTSSSQEVLSESKAYENPQFKRMKDLMSKLK